MSHADDSGSRSFRALLSLGMLGIVGVCVVIARRTGFVGDAFAFLDYLQRPGAWSWADTFLPLEGRFWPFYRPVGMDSYFYLGHWAFGLDPFGYILVALAMHFASGWILYRIGRQLGFHALPAAGAAALMVTRPPALSMVFLLHMFMYISAAFFGLASTAVFLRHARRGGGLALTGSCLLYVPMLLSNESSVTLPAILLILSLHVDRFAISRQTVQRALARVSPHLVLTLFYLVFRFRVLPPKPLSYAYRMSLGGHSLDQYLVQLLNVMGGAPNAWAFALGAAVLGGIVWVQRAREPEAARWLVAMNGVCLAWIAIALLPFALLKPQVIRFAIPLQAPVCLLLAAYVDAAWRVRGRTHQRLLEVGLLVGIFLSVPYGMLRGKIREPDGTQPRKFLTMIAEQARSETERGQIVVLYGADALGDDQVARMFRNRSYSTAAVRVWFGSRYRTKFVNLGDPLPDPVAAERCIFASLLPDLETRLSDPALLARAIPGGPQRLCVERAARMLPDAR